MAAFQRGREAPHLGRDFEITSYFPHVRLSERLVRTLFIRLAQAGVRVGAPDAERYPALDHLASIRGGGTRVVEIDPEQLLRSPGPDSPRGYGVVPLLVSVPVLLRPAPATLQFEVHSARHPELDGIHLRFDDAGLRLPRIRGDDPVGPGWSVLLKAYGALCNVLHVAYGYGDWEDYFLMAAIPASRADVLAGRLDLLFRLNCFGPALVKRFGEPHLLAAPAQVVIREPYGGVLLGGKLEYERGDEDAFRRTAAHLGLRAGVGAELALRGLCHCSK